MFTIPRGPLVALMNLVRFKSMWLGDNSELVARQQQLAQREREPDAKLAQRVDFARAEFDGFTYFTLTPKGRAAGGGIFYLHGGAYVFDISKQHWEFLTDMCARSGQTIYVPLYPLAPQHQMPEVFDWTYRLFRQVQDATGAKIALAGDSAGGGLALALAMQLRDDAVAAPTQVILISPWLDILRATSEMQAIQDPMLDLAGLLRCGELYLGPHPDDLRSSPLAGDFRNLPPLHVLTGTRDLLHPLAREFRNRANEQGVPVNYLVSPGSLHVYPIIRTADGLAAREQLLDLLPVL